MRRLNHRPFRWLVLLGVVASGAGVMLASSAARAADAPAATPRVVTVSGTGTVKTKPSVVELSGTITGEAELAADATVKYRDAKRRALKAIEGLKIASLSIVSKGVSLNQSSDMNAQQMMFRGGQPQTNVKQMVQVSEQFQILLKDADKMPDEELMTTVLKVVDAARDAGLVIGPGGPKTYQQMMMMAQFGQTSGGGLATFKVPDATALRSQAYQKSMEDAKAKAQRLAELAGAKLGKVVAVHENGGGGSGGGDSSQMMWMFRMMMNEPLQKSADSDNELTSTSNGEISMSVTLSVEFALE